MDTPYQIQEDISSHIVGLTFETPDPDYTPSIENLFQEQERLEKREIKEIR